MPQLHQGSARQQHDPEVPARAPLSTCPCCAMLPVTELPAIVSAHVGILLAQNCQQIHALGTDCAPASQASRQADLHSTSMAGPVVKCSMRLS